MKKVFNREKELAEHKAKLQGYRKQLEKLRLKYFSEFAPSGYKTKTSYTDAELIHARNRELNMFQLFDEVGQLRKLIMTEEDIIATLRIEYGIETTLKSLTTNYQKVMFLKDVLNYTDLQVARAIGISARQVGRLYKKEQFS